MIAKPRVVASIEARMSSSRLPGKVLADLDGRPLLGRLADRLRRCRMVDDIIVATSVAKADDVLADWCAAENLTCYRGSEDDVLERVVDAHASAGTEVIVEITGDCPLTDPDVVDLGVETFLAHKVDVVTNCGNILTWPMGVYVQVFAFDQLVRVESEITDPAVREHVSLYFYENPGRYQTLNLLAPRRWRRQELRLQVDYPEDLVLNREIFTALQPVHGDAFGIEEVLALLERRPELAAINAHCQERAPR